VKPSRFSCIFARHFCVCLRVIVDGILVREEEGNRREYFTQATCYCDFKQCFIRSSMALIFLSLSISNRRLQVICG
jgi:hypothetical protein